MEKEEAHHLLALHSGRMGAFVEGYRFVLRYKTGKREELRRGFEEVIACLRVLEEEFHRPVLPRLLLADLNELLLGGILAMNKEGAAPEAAVFTMVLAETITALLEKNPRPFEAYERYPENYDNQLSQ